MTSVPCACPSASLASPISPTSSILSDGLFFDFEHLDIAERTHAVEVDFRARKNYIIFHGLSAEFASESKVRAAILKSSAGLQRWADCNVVGSYDDSVEARSCAEFAESTEFKMTKHWRQVPGDTCHSE